ncbi:MAG: group II intron reverse transcriptase domain-containing protein [Candidatus Liptonbacteria bacterium]|nr:group II intron reverse transcriptase domain-containing protein [Candidatus Liptonbacteria bacterium]
MNYRIPNFEDTFSFQNLFHAWITFSKGKRRKVDVAEFAARLVDNLRGLERDILGGKYKHGGYAHFKISDPKPRDIHKASVRDRVAHHAIYEALYPYFERYFIYDSYSCRKKKGTHKALRRLAAFVGKEGANGTKTVLALTCDIAKCFTSVNHAILIKILEKHIGDKRLLAVIQEVINSFSGGVKGRGIPLGNLTSQLFINLYLNELDQFIKRDLEIRRYIRYADDFVMLSRDPDILLEYLPKIADFLEERLRLTLHPKKIVFKTVSSGVDFLGWVHFTEHRVLRTKTKQRMEQRLFGKPKHATIASYAGLLIHGNAHKLREAVRQKIQDDF